MLFFLFCSYEMNRCTAFGPCTTRHMTPTSFAHVFSSLLLLQELEARVVSACSDLGLPLPIPVSVLLGSLGPPGPGGVKGNVFREIVDAALHPDGHVPDTPARKVSRVWANVYVFALGFRPCMGLD